MTTSNCEFVWVRLQSKWCCLTSILMLNYHSLCPVRNLIQHRGMKIGIRADELPTTSYKEKRDDNTIIVVRDLFDVCVVLEKEQRRGEGVKGELYRP